MLVDVSTVARALELSPRRVQQLVSEGWLPREERGVYCLPDVLRAYGRYLEEIEGRKGVGGAIDAARARKYRAQAELRRIEMAVEAGELVEIEEALDQVDRDLSALRHALLSLPSLADRLAPADREVREEILREELEHAVAHLELEGAA